MPRITLNIAQMLPESLQRSAFGFANRGWREVQVCGDIDRAFTIDRGSDESLPSDRVDP